MKTISAEEFKKMYGTQGVAAFEQTEKKSGFGQRTKEAFNAGVSKVKQGFQEAGDGKKNPISTGMKIGMGAVEAGFSPLTAGAEPVIRPTIGRAINYAADKISDSPSVQKFANSKAGEFTSRRAEDVVNFTGLAGTVGGSKYLTGQAAKIPKVINNTTNKINNSTNRISEMPQPIKNMARDLVPTKDRIVNSNVTKSLDLTSGDASNFFQSTGKDVGRFVADHNLIRQNKDLTVGAIDDFYKQNYKAVRTEIDKVKTVYQPSQVPRYVESLKAIKSVTDDVPGLQKVSVEVDNLLNKKNNIILSDVQKVKELVDKYHGIYKRTGDVKDGVKAQGLGNIRSELRKFIEVEVKKNTGADISELNLNVSGSKSILEMVKVRSPRGLTTSNLKVGDWAAFGTGVVMTFPVLGPLAPLGGIAAIFVKKAFQSPAIMLRIAKYLDKLSDAEQIKIKANLEAGKIPPEFNQFIKKK